MFKFFRERRQSINALNACINRLKTDNADLVSEIDRLTHEASVDSQQKKITIEGLKEERDAVAECLEDEQKRNMALEAKVDDLEAGVAQLKEALAHGIHGLAAFQSFSDAIQKRLAMLPNQLGLSDELAKEVLGDFDQDLKDREALARQVSKESYYIERNASDDGHLIDEAGIAQHLTVKEVQDAIFGQTTENNPHPGWSIGLQLDDGEPIDSIKELGLFKIEVNYGKGVKGEARIWIVPTATKAS